MTRWMKRLTGCGTRSPTLGCQERWRPAGSLSHNLWIMTIPKMIIENDHQRSKRRNPHLGMKRREVCSVCGERSWWSCSDFHILRNCHYWVSLSIVVVVLILLVSTVAWCCRANIPLDSAFKIYMRPFSCQHHESFSVFFISTPLVVLLSAPAMFRS